MPIEPTSPFVFAKPAPSEQESAPALIAAVLVAAGLAVGGSVFAFAAEKQEGRAAADCAASDGTAATAPPSGPSSGTKPGGDGSTAWTGGTGGSYVGTTPGAPTPSSKTDQPATASGIDPTKSTTGSGRDRC